MRKIFLCFWLFLALGFTNKVVGQFAGGSGTALDPYQISTPEHLAQLHYHLNNGNVHFKLLNNIDLTNYLTAGGAGHNGGAGWLPIGNASNKFSGTLNGAGFKIIGLWINRNETKYIGLFGWTSLASISNLGIEISSFGISGEDCVGGLAGVNIQTHITNCYTIGNVSGGSAVGGLVGNNQGTISNCYAIGNVRGGFEAGGLIGANYASITNSYATGSVGGETVLGGLVGSCRVGASISNCYAIGNVSGTWWDNTGAGGLVGYNEGYIGNSFATGSVSGVGPDVGGLVGSNINASIANSYATGNVSGSSNVGGLVGKNENTSITNAIANCYATGNVKGSTAVGGFIGFHNSGTVNNSFFDYQTTGQMYGVGGGSGSVNNLAGKPTVEMKKKSTFTSVGWDFTTVWGINEGVTYPFLINGSVGINEPVQNVNIQLYPNPTNGQIHIESKEWKVKNVEIFDVFGKNIRINTQIRPENSETETVINISHLPAGVYFVRISTETGVVIKKVQKE